MESVRLGGVALVGLVSLFLLRQVKPEWAPFIRIAVAVLSFGVILSMTGTVLDSLRELSLPVGDVLGGEAGSILLKALGIALITELSASICRDSGETGLAGWVETAGKLEILLLSLPLIRTVLDTVATLLQEA